MGIKTLTAGLLALAFLSGHAALAEELRGRVTNVDREAGTLEIGGQTIHVREDVLNGVVEGSRYTVRWEESNGRNVATQVVQDND